MSAAMGQTLAESEKQKLDSISKKIEENQAQIKASRRKEKQVVNKLGQLKRDIYVETRRLQTTQHKLKVYSTKVLTTEEELEKTRKKHDEIKQLLDERLVAMYKNTNLGFLEFIFSPVDYAKALNHSYIFEKTIKKDTELMKEVQALEAQLDQKKNQLLNEKNTIESLKNSIVKRKHSLNDTRSNLDKNLQSLRQQIEEFERQNKELERESEQIARLIRSQDESIKLSHAKGSYVRPTKGWISSKFGYRMHPIFKRRILHSGMDFAAPQGREIKASNFGYVIFAGWKKGYGNVTIINHGWSEGKTHSTLYAHQRRIIVRKGQFVRKGQIIGYVGTTGYSTGPHLHFETRQNGRPVNPNLYLKLY
ncbi:MAG: peptidoglycan DD-metalloendopeptidase family protein [bacterium]|nr:peptidoglycan DD-metalloendopeptidase family protein [bacterium]